MHTLDPQASPAKKSMATNQTKRRDSGLFLLNFFDRRVRVCRGKGSVETSAKAAFASSGGKTRAAAAGAKHTRTRKNTQARRGNNRVPRGPGVAAAAFLLRRRHKKHKAVEYPPSLFLNRPAPLTHPHHSKNCAERFQTYKPPLVVAGWPRRAPGGAKRTHRETTQQHKKRTRQSVGRERERAHARA